MTQTNETVIESPVVRTKDKYDEAIAYLTEHPQEISAAFNDGYAHRGSPGFCLFVAAAPKGMLAMRRDGVTCGCLVAIRSGNYEAWTEDATKRIRGNLSLPDNAEMITPQHLIHFANEQRRLDKELNRA